jgi:signal recognition particle receptor subunit beta
MDSDAPQEPLVIKLVYYGPALSGKTTNLMRLHDLLQPELIGNLMTMETQDDRTLFFDLLPLGFRTASGLLVKIKLFTVPGQVQHDSTRKAVLSRADGVVFVADSQRNQSINNGEAFQNLAENAARVGLDFDTLPLVVQFNKRDLPAILSEEEVLARWGKAPWPVVFSVALTGQGVIETFEQLLHQVYTRMDEQHQLARVHDLTRDAFTKAIIDNQQDTAISTQQQEPSRD